MGVSPSALLAPSAVLGHMGRWLSPLFVRTATTTTIKARQISTERRGVELQVERLAFLLSLPSVDNHCIRRYFSGSHLRNYGQRDCNHKIKLFNSESFCPHFHAECFEVPALDVVCSMYNVCHACVTMTNLNDDTAQAQ